MNIATNGDKNDSNSRSSNIRVCGKGGKMVLRGKQR